MGKITATISDMPMGGGTIYKQKDADIINRILDLEQEMNTHIDQLEEIRDEIVKIINAQTDDQERLLLHYRYIEDRTWVQVCVLMSYEWAQTHRIHSRALDNLKIEIKEATA